MERLFPTRVDEFLGKLVQKYEELSRKRVKESLKESERDLVSTADGADHRRYRNGQTNRGELKAVAEREGSHLGGRIRAETILQRARRGHRNPCPSRGLQREGESFRFRFRALLEQYLACSRTAVLVRSNSQSLVGDRSG